ncbi:MAG: hypothetical protein FJY85_03875 [Deltaproteobacteria bacterium]|nr:hypothetical protein [Deltaproteobacteria bacterium]
MVNLSSGEGGRWDRETGETRETMARWTERSEGVSRADRSPKRAVFTKVPCRPTANGAHAARPTLCPHDQRRADRCAFPLAGRGVDRLEEWRYKALYGMEADLKGREYDPLRLELDHTLKKVGELLMENGILKKEREIVSRLLPRRRPRG